MTSRRAILIIKTALRAVKGQTGRKYAELAPARPIQRQVMRMNAYEIIMICIASMTLLLKLIEALTGKNQK